LVVVPEVSPENTVVQLTLSLETCRSNRLRRMLPWYAAVLMWPIDIGEPRSNFTQAPSPLPDQRVARLLSTVPAPTLVSLVLVVTPEAAGVTSL
jgi:hypothetical protein